MGWVRRSPTAWWSRDPINVWQNGKSKCAIPHNPWVFSWGWNWIENGIYCSDENLAVCFGIVTSCTAWSPRKQAKPHVRMLESLCYWLKIYLDLASCWEYMWYFICEPGNTDKWCSKWFKRPTVHKPKRSRCKCWLHVKKVECGSVSWGELWAVLQIMLDSRIILGGEKKDWKCLYIWVTLMPNIKIFENIQMSGITITNVLDKELCGCFFSSIPYYGAAKIIFEKFLYYI